MPKYLREADDNETFWRLQLSWQGNRPNTVTTWTHDSGLIRDHNMACFVCHDAPAVLKGVQTSFGGPMVESFQPCAACQEKGWRVVKLTRRGLALPFVAGMAVGFSLIAFAVVLIAFTAV